MTALCLPSGGEVATVPPNAIPEAKATEMARVYRDAIATIESMENAGPAPWSAERDERQAA